MDLIDDYDERSVADVLATVDDRDFSADELRTIRDYEQAQKDRSTLVPELEERIDEADADGDEDTDATTADAADADAEPATISPSERDAEELWISPRTANIGEYSFRTLYTPQKVRRTHRVEQALEDGRAIEVDAPDDTEA